DAQGNTQEPRDDREVFYLGDDGHLIQVQAKRAVHQVSGRALCTTRPLPAPHDGATEAADPTDLRSRRHRVGGLRPPGAGADRLHPAKGGAAGVPPWALLRGPDQGLLARQPPAGRRAPRQRDARPARGVLREVPAGVRLTILPADKGFYAHKLVDW